MNERHSPEQIVRRLREADEKLAAGTSIPEVARQLGSARRPSTAGGTNTAG